MKTVLLVLGLVCAASPTLWAQVRGQPPVELKEARAYSIVERGANHRLWQQVVEEPNYFGKITLRTNEVTELETGMYFRQDGQWVESSTEIELLADGAIARKGPNKVVFAANINSAGAIDLTTPDGKQLRSHVFGLSYFDTATGKAVLIAEVKDSIGLLLPPNQILYTNAFTDFHADLRYTYTKAGFEQDVILREQIPSPLEWGLDPRTTRLQVLTEFLSPPTLRRSPASERATNLVSDAILNFGATKIGRGKAFSLGEPGERRHTVPVSKQWIQLEGRTFLIEEVIYQAIETPLKVLPKGSASVIKPGRSGSGETVIAALGSYLAKRVANTTSRPIQVARLDVQTTPGFVLDYQTLSSESDFTFRADTTYYVSGTVYLDGTTVIEGGTVVKYATNATASIILYGAIKCDTAPYRPAIFTSKDDNTIGQAISGSTGNPTGYYGGSALALADCTVLENFRFSYFRTGVEDGGAGISYLHDVQFVKCRYPITLEGDTFYIRNGLFYQTATNFYGSGSIQGEHLTFHNSGALFHDPNGNVGSTISLTNCLLVTVTNLGSYYTVTSNSTVRLTSDAGIFQTVGAGGHYLADGSPYRNAGTTGINPGMLAELKRTTTYPPLVYSNATVTSATILGPQAQRDTDTPDLGYHYDPLDYAFGGTTVNSNLTFTAGTAVAWFRTSAGWYHAGHGIRIADKQLVHFDGRAEAPNYWVRFNTVQEQVNDNWAGGYGPGGITGWSDTIADQPEIRMRFTRCSAPANEMQHFRDDYGCLFVNITDCEIFGGGVGGYVSTVGLTNCLLYRSNIGLEGGVANFYVLRNCLVYGCGFALNRWPEEWGGPGTGLVPTAILDCAFDGTTIFTADAHADEPEWTHYDHNAFLAGGDQVYPAGANDVVVTNFSWLHGALGDFYQPTNSALINAGSGDADAAGLYHYTTDASQAKEAASTNDIGLHYVAVTSAVPATIWVEDAVPAGVDLYTDDDSWNWISSSPPPYSGSVSHQSDSVGGFHQHLFSEATETLELGGEDSLFCYVYLITNDVPNELMLQWEANDDSWWYHRASWGPDDLQWSPRTYQRSVPTSEAWLRLEVPARSVGLEGRTLAGMAYTLSSGTAVWDYAGKVGRRVPVDTDGDGIPDYWEDTNGDGIYAAGDLADWNSADTDGDGLPDAIDAYPGIYDTSLPEFTITAPVEDAIF